MKQHCVTEQQASEELYRQIEDSWKLLNQQLLKPSTTGFDAAEFVPPRAVLLRVVNLARVIDVAYKHNDEYTHVGEVMRSYITSMFIKPVSV